MLSTSGGVRGKTSRAYLQLKWQPLGDVRTGARHADVRLGGLWNRHCLEEEQACVPLVY